MPGVGYLGDSVGGPARRGFGLTAGRRPGPGARAGLGLTAGRCACAGEGLTAGRYCGYAASRGAGFTPGAARRWTAAFGVLARNSWRGYAARTAGGPAAGGAVAEPETLGLAGATAGSGSRRASATGAFGAVVTGGGEFGARGAAPGWK